MNDKAIFTIISKNYISLAKILLDSIRKHHSDLDFYAFITDEPSLDLDHHAAGIQLLVIKELQLIDNFHDLAFKYNITEFCTFVKPYCFEHLFKNNYKKVIYFDPDIYVFSSLEPILAKLDTFSFVLTPHITRPEINYSGIFREGNFLNNGTFNLGFIALSNLDPAPYFIQWWKERLKAKCFVDVIDGYFTDQKWIDFVPALFSNFFIEKGPAYNIAIWNLHEREVDEVEGVLKCRYRDNENWEWGDVVFIHFSNFNFTQCMNGQKFYPLELHRCKDFVSIAEFYRGKLKNSNFIPLQKKYPYSYNSFVNGFPVLKFHRRFYRRLLESGKSFSNPFDTNTGSFFLELKKKHLIYNDPDNFNSKDATLIEKKVKGINKLFAVLKKVIGMRRYALFCRFAVRYFRYENQTFLLSQVGRDIKFLNDTEYINDNA